MQIAAQHLGKVVLAETGARDHLGSMGNQHLVTGGGHLS